LRIFCEQRYGIVPDLLPRLCNSDPITPRVGEAQLDRRWTLSLLRDHQAGKFELRGIGTGISDLGVRRILPRVPGWKSLHTRLGSIVYPDGTVYGAIEVLPLALSPTAEAPQEVANQSAVEPAASPACVDGESPLAETSSASSPSAGQKLSRHRKKGDTDAARSELLYQAARPHAGSTAWTRGSAVAAAREKFPTNRLLYPARMQSYSKAWNLAVDRLQRERTNDGDPAPVQATTQ